MLKKKDKRTINNRIDLLRIIVMSVIFGVFVLLFFVKLVDLQLFKHDDYVAEVVPKIYRMHTVEMSRGHIYDRHGEPLVTNRKIYNVVVDISTIDGKDYNSVLLSFIEFCNKNGIVLGDKLPVSESYPYSFNEDYIFDSDMEKKLSSFVEQNNLSNEPLFGNDDAFYKFLCNRYGAEDEDTGSKNCRKLIGLRYDMETNSFGYLDYHVLLSGVDENTRILISENLHRFHGISVVSEDVRYYNNGSLAAHVLGRIGKLDASDVEKYVEGLGYSYNELIGREGAEKAFEEYLHGYNGVDRYEELRCYLLVGQPLDQTDDYLFFSF